MTLRSVSEVQWPVLSLGNLFRALRRSETPLLFTTPDPREVTATNHSHPAPQCRLDTYFAGSVYARGYDETVSQSEANKGTCNRADEYEIGLEAFYVGLSLLKF